MIIYIIYILILIILIFVSFIATKAIKRGIEAKKKINKNINIDNFSKKKINEKKWIYLIYNYLNLIF